jgi:hypothetical protein
MSNKLVLVLATITMFASAAALPTSAFARPGPNHPGPNHPGPKYPGPKYPGPKYPGPNVKHHWCHHNDHRCHPHWQVNDRYGAPVAYAVTSPAVAGPCTCLTKQYTPEGAVLFKDICTNEAAMNPPIQAVAPQQTGMYQAQPQQMLPQQPIPQAQ